MDFGSKLAQLRREKGWSQEQLADLLGVTRQSVSKWEAGSAMPEINKLVALSDHLGVSLDALLRDGRELSMLAPESQTAPAAAPAEVMEELGEIKRYLHDNRFYEYKSRAALFGIPLVHIRLSRSGGYTPAAKGIIAIGNIAVGVVSLGGIAVGLFSLGGLSLGLLLALGGLAVGGVALGGAAIGLLALGGAAVGVYAAGGGAVGSVLAVGGAASAPVAVGDAVRGVYTLSIGEASRAETYRFITTHCPGIWDWLARMLSALA